MPTLKKDILLLGFRGVGKSTLGRYLAKKYSLKFIDVDIALEEKIQGKLSDYAKNRGENNFREKEFEQVQEIFSEKEKRGRLISMGGGVVEYEKSYQLLKSLSDAKKILLEIDTNALWKRLKNFTPEEERIGKIKDKEEFIKVWKKRRNLFQEVVEETIFLEAEDSIRKNAASIEKKLGLL